MRLPILLKALGGTALGHFMLIGSAVANVEANSQIDVDYRNLQVNPLAVVAIYGASNASAVCLTTTSSAFAQESNQTSPATTTEQPETVAGATPKGCVLPMVDSPAVVTPAAESEIAPLLALGPILAAAGIATTAAAIASSAEGGTPVSPG